ncbi:CD1375 family protein [Exiguobacterium sp. s196]|nr:CD1375 family protein [Exiguobacterium sp. s196]
MYVLLVKEGRRTLEQVPEKHRADVETELKKQGGN